MGRVCKITGRRPGSLAAGRRLAAKPPGIGGKVPPGGGHGRIGWIMTSRFEVPLITWYATSARDLPWRRAGVAAWPILVSEIMLQQTPVSRVLPAYEAWLARWPTAPDLAAASPADAVRQSARLGYPGR